MLQNFSRCSITAQSGKRPSLAYLGIMEAQLGAPLIWAINAMVLRSSEGLDPHDAQKLYSLSVDRCCFSCWDYRYLIYRNRLNGTEPRNVRNNGKFLDELPLTLGGSEIG